MAKKHNIVIVGNGLFGSIAARLARAEGHTVTVVSDDRPLSASKASGCVLAPSWLNSMERPAIETAMTVLGGLFPVHELEFQTALKPFKAKRVALEDVLVLADSYDHVTGVGNGIVRTVAGTEYRGKVLVAAGAWCKELIPDMPAIRGLYGASVVFKGVQLDVPRLSVWAPYKQAVGFNLDKKHVWFGDGTALIEKTWAKRGEQAAETTVRRGDHMLYEAGKSTIDHKVTVGIRPYVEGYKAGYFERVHPNTWVSTGGAKNGTVLAAYQAAEFLRSLP